METIQNDRKTDIVIVGTGVSGLFAALNLPADKEIMMITKRAAEESDSYLAQGGICVLKDSEDYHSYFEDTMRAGHYENRRRSVEIMIESSQEIIRDLIGYHVEFEKEDGEFVFTREGAHSTPRILFKQDITGKEITSKLLQKVRQLKNVTLMEYTTMVDILESKGECCGISAIDENGNGCRILADYTILASGGIGGLFSRSTNYPHLTGDAIAICLRHGIDLKDIDYIQIHPTTLYSMEEGRSFLISESVRGEGAVLYDKYYQRFVNELLPRDVVVKAVFKQMELDATPYVLLSMEHIDKAVIKTHFRHIYEHCLEAGYDVTKDCIPVVPSQHYHMGGIDVDEQSRTSMRRLYAVGETSCNGVHGANRLASNSMLESLVFAKRAAQNIASGYRIDTGKYIAFRPDVMDYTRLNRIYKDSVMAEIERVRKCRAQ
ncbi:MAG: L-aspartate oxidase [Actinobacteria bacterium]|nr:L-aspartate oxidase [Actinomycetota bacterium]